MPSHGPDGPGPSAGSGAADASPSQDSQIKSLQEQLQSALTEIGDLRQRALAESQSHASLSALQAESGSAGAVQLRWQQELCIHHIQQYVSLQRVFGGRHGMVSEEVSSLHMVSGLALAP